VSHRPWIVRIFQVMLNPVCYRFSLGMLQFQARDVQHSLTLNVNDQGNWPLRGDEGETAVVVYMDVVKEDSARKTFVLEIACQRANTGLVLFPVYLNGWEHLSLLSNDT
jgi:hypothetical protein